MARLSCVNTVEFPPANIPIISNIQQLPLYKSECFLREKYLEEKLSARQIAALTVSARSTILKYLEEYDIPMRSEDETLLHNKGQMAYGERLVNRQIIAHQREIETIEKIRALRKQGLSYWKISDVLNAMDIPTKTRRAKWQAATVMKILKRINGL